MSGASAPIALVTGGCGFIGSNLARRLLEEGRRVALLDDLSRVGARANAAWLDAMFPGQVSLVVADICDGEVVRELVAAADQVFHLAAQVAVTTSLSSPERDFVVNAGGTLTLLEAIRTSRSRPGLVFASTNKVYGELEDVSLAVRDGRYEPVDVALRDHGVSEARPLDLRSPYGCSKGAADQYVLDYARTFGLTATAFRMSCVYGPRQLGSEDQGWVAHLVGAARRGDQLTLFGDGRQVRDVLFVDDLVDAFLAARDHADLVSGRAFNVGGGPGRCLSLLELVDRIAALHGERPKVRHAPWRTSDQRWFVADTSRLTQATGWRPTVSVDEGLARLDAWLASVWPSPRPAVAGGA